MADQQYTIHLNNVVRTPSTRKANRAIFAIKQFVQKHTHAKKGDIHISNDINEVVWARGKEHKINRLEVVLRTKEGKVHVFSPAGKDLKAFEGKAAPAKGKKEAKTAEKKDEKKIALEKAVKDAMKETPAKAAESKAPAAKKASAEKATE